MKALKVERRELLLTDRMLGNRWSESEPEIFSDLQKEEKVFLRGSGTPA